jgi:hypothetical protein
MFNKTTGSVKNRMVEILTQGKFFYYLIYVIMALMLIHFSFGINDAGERTVVQYPNGTLYVKFSPGIYFKAFGTTHRYWDVSTYDFDKAGSSGKNNENSLVADGIRVRYQDGGTGIVYGKARFALPNDVETMIRLHRDFREKFAVAQKLIRTVTEESMNLTAGLMTSEEAYAEKRGIFTQWAEQQVASGKFYTELKSVVEKQEVTNERQTRNIPVIKYGTDGLPVQHASDFKM